MNLNHLPHCGHTCSQDFLFPFCLLPTLRADATATAAPSARRHCYRSSQLHVPLPLHISCNACTTTPSICSNPSATAPPRRAGPWLNTPLCFPPLSTTTTNKEFKMSLEHIITLGDYNLSTKKAKAVMTYIQVNHPVQVTHYKYFVPTANASSPRTTKSCRQTFVTNQKPRTEPQKPHNHTI